MTFLVEWTSSVKNRKGRMVSLTALGRLLNLPDPGYSSIYMFKEEDAKIIVNNGHSKGLNQYAVASKFLVVDVDSGEEGRSIIEGILRSKGYAYEIWSSGGKGYHFYIPHELICDKRLPNSHKQVALSLFPKQHVDLTLYQHGRLVSLPGRVHPITKKRKHLIASIPGKSIEIPLVEELKVVRPFEVSPDGDHQLLAIGLQRAADLICFPPDRGTRHIRIWGTAKDLAESGLDYDTTLNLLLKVNETWDEQKTEEEIIKAVTSAYKLHGQN